jgi:hypothetical protein
MRRNEASNEQMAAHDAKPCLLGGNDKSRLPDKLTTVNAFRAPIKIINSLHLAASVWYFTLCYTLLQ